MTLVLYETTSVLRVYSLPAILVSKQNSLVSCLPLSLTHTFSLCLSLSLFRQWNMHEGGKWWGGGGGACRDEGKTMRLPPLSIYSAPDHLDHAREQRERRRKNGQNQPEREINEGKWGSDELMRKNKGEIKHAVLIKPKSFYFVALSPG